MQLRESLGTEDSQSGEKVVLILKASITSVCSEIYQEYRCGGCEQAIICISTLQLLCNYP